MQGSQEGKHANLWGPRAHFGAKIPMKIPEKILRRQSKPKFKVREYCCSREYLTVVGVQQ